MRAPYQHPRTNAILQPEEDAFIDLGAEAPAETEHAAEALAEPAPVWSRHLKQSPGDLLREQRYYDERYRRAEGGGA